MKFRNIEQIFTYHYSTHKELFIQLSSNTGQSAITRYHLNTLFWSRYRKKSCFSLFSFFNSMYVKVEQVTLAKPIDRTTGKIINRNCIQSENKYYKSQVQSKTISIIPFQEISLEDEVLIVENELVGTFIISFHLYFASNRWVLESIKCRSSKTTRPTSSVGMQFLHETIK